MVAPEGSSGGGGGTDYVLVAKHLLAGGIAGAVSRTVVSPLERVKILFQVQGPGQADYRGVLHTLYQIWAKEGFMGYLKGNGTNVIRIAPYSAVQFASYEKYKQDGCGALDHTVQWLLRFSGTASLNTYQTLLAGAAAGITSATTTYPLDLVRTRLSVQTPANQRYNGIWHATTVIYREEGGVLALYRGLGATVLGVAPYVAINFTVYETLRSWIVVRRGRPPQADEKLVCGALAGVTGQTLTYPFDVVRRRLQVDAMPGSAYRYTGVRGAFATIWKREGVRGFFKGMIPNYLKVAPSVSASFVTYEWAKGLLKA